MVQMKISFSFSKKEQKSKILADVQIYTKKVTNNYCRCFDFYFQQTQTNNQLNEISFIEAFVTDYSHLNEGIAAYSFWNVLSVKFSPLVIIFTNFFECLELYQLFTETLKDEG